MSTRNVLIGAVFFTLAVVVVAWTLLSPEEVSNLAVQTTRVVPNVVWAITIAAMGIAGTAPAWALDSDDPEYGRAFLSWLFIPGLLVLFWITCPCRHEQDGSAEAILPDCSCSEAPYGGEG